MAKKSLVRLGFRTKVFARDKYCCVYCKAPGKDRQGGDEHLKYHKDCKTNLDSHHITPREEMPHGGYVPENGISLCDQCHELAEKELKNPGEAPDYSPDKLYALVKSSKEKAVKASENIK